MEEIKQHPGEGAAPTNKMATMPMGKLIASMAMPAMLAMLIQALYNIVDSIYVSMISEEALYAVSLAFPLQTLLIAVAVGTGVGLNSLISRRLGAGNTEEASNAAAHGLVLAVISGVFFLVFGLLVTVPYFRVFADNPEAFAGGVSYTRLVLCLSVFALVSINTEKIIQATGNMVIPMVQNLAGAITNIILDPILIFGLLGAPAMGVTGAAVATLIGQFVSMAVGLGCLFFRKHSVKVSFRGFKMRAGVVLQIYQVGLPAIVMQAIASVMLTGMNYIIKPLSDTAVTVLSIYFKLQSFVFMPVFGLTQGAMPVMGYSYGARNKARLMQAYKISFITAFCIMLAGTILFWSVPGSMLSLFNASDHMLAIGVPALRAISLSFIGAAFGIVNSTVFQAVGRGSASLIVSIMRQLVVILPAAWLLARFFGLNAVWYAFPIAELVSFVVSLFLLARIYKNELRDLA